MDNDSKEPPKSTLLVPADAALERIKAQIEKGAEIKKRQIGSEDDLDEAIKDKNSWSSYNSNLIKNILETDPPTKLYVELDCHDLYKFSLGSASRWLKRHINFELEQLESLHGEIEIVSTLPFDDIAPSVDSDEMIVDIFISHSSKDRDVAAALIELLRAALNIPSDKVRCTSVDGYRLPAGASTDEQLRQEIYAAKVFIGLITPTSFQSTYVLFELGARWGARLPLAPVLASGADASTLRQPLASLNALSCDVASQVYQLVGDIAASLKMSANNPPAYQRYVEALVRASEEGREQSRNHSNIAGAISAEASAFTPSEEIEFRHIYRTLNRSMTVEVGVYQRKPNEKSSSRIRTDVFKANLLAALTDFVSQGQNYYHYQTFESLLSRQFENKPAFSGAPDVTLTYGSTEINEHISKELQRYGLVRHTRIVRTDREESAFEFTEKMHRFIYWLEFNNLFTDKVSFEFVEQRSE